jgi:hypothetical protein
MTRPAATVVLVGWVLLMGGPSGGWRPLGTYEQKWLCAHVRAETATAASGSERRALLSPTPVARRPARAHFSTRA